MFTIQQIKEAHSKVKIGADFPQYILDLIDLGVTSYETFVGDNHTDYFGKNNFKISSDGNQELYAFTRDKSNIEQFKIDLKNHQQGDTSYMQFLSDCMKSGVEKWVVMMDKMTCTYYDKSGNVMLIEKVPEP